MSDNKEKKKGRGWHGDPKAHAEAGRLGGKVRAKKAKEKKEKQK